MKIFYKNTSKIISFLTNLTFYRRKRLHFYFADSTHSSNTWNKQKLQLKEISKKKKNALKISSSCLQMWPARHTFINYTKLQVFFFWNQFLFNI